MTEAHLIGCLQRKRELIVMYKPQLPASLQNKTLLLLPLFPALAGQVFLTLCLHDPQNSKTGDGTRSTWKNLSNIAQRFFNNITTSKKLKISLLFCNKMTIESEDKPHPDWSTATTVVSAPSVTLTNIQKRTVRIVVLDRLVYWLVQDHMDGDGPHWGGSRLVEVEGG